jgi:hypothetical protein
LDNGVPNSSNVPRIEVPVYVSDINTDIFKTHRDQNREDISTSSNSMSESKGFLRSEENSEIELEDFQEKNAVK